jgi:signal recognition particle subunit SRP54
MIPGIGSQIKTANIDERALIKVEAIINSMTLEERTAPKVLNGSRRKRIARGSGTSVQDVNRLIKQFSEMQKMIGQLSKKGSMFKNLKFN